LNTLKLAAWMLIGLGSIETTLLIWALISNGSFSGGAFLYIIAGLSLLKKNTTDYKVVLFILTCISALIPAAIAMSALTAFQVVTATDIPLSWKGFGFGGASIVVILYILMVSVLLALLYHPHTRKILSLNVYSAVTIQPSEQSKRLQRLHRQ